jgi:hypothetical protein
MEAAPSQQSAQQPRYQHIEISSDGLGRREAAICHARGVRLIEVLSGRRETHSRYLWNTKRECRAGTECAMVLADFVFGRLPKLHLRHV